MSEVFTYQYPHYAIAIDIVTFAYNPGEHGVLRVGVLQRSKPPFEGKCALPSAFLHAQETGTDTCQRVLQTTGLTPTFIEQLKTFDAPDRDPRERVFSISYLAGVRETPSNKSIEWLPLTKLPPAKQWAFDHHHIVEQAINRLRGKITYTPVAFGLLPKQTAISDILDLYETVLGHPIDKRNFYKKIKSLHILKSGEKFTGERGAPKQLFSFKGDRKELTHYRPNFQLP